MKWKFSSPAGTKVIGAREEGPDGRVLVRLQSTVTADPLCPYCSGERFKNGTRIVRFRDIPTDRAQPVVIEWLRQKHVCRTCHRSSHDQHQAFDQRRDMTARFVEWIGREATERGFTAVANETSVNAKVARRVFRTTEKKLGVDFHLLSNAIAIDLIDLAGSKRPAIIDARHEFVFEIYASVQEMGDRLPAFAKEYSCLYEEQIVVADLSLVECGSSAIFDNFGSRAEKVICPTSVQREVTRFLWSACEPLLQGKHGDSNSQRFLRTLFFRRKRSMMSIARNHVAAWKRDEPELYAAYELKEDFLSIWSTTAGLEGRIEAWIQRVAQYPDLQLGRLMTTISMHRKEVIAFSRHVFLSGFYERFLEITSLGKRKTGRSFSAARAALLMQGRLRAKKNLDELFEHAYALLDKP